MQAINIIHTVGPVYNEHTKEDNAQLLANCYLNCLQLAKDTNASSIAFPAISTGAYGYPMADAATIAINACVKQDYPIDIYLYLFEKISYSIWANALIRV